MQYSNKWITSTHCADIDATAEVMLTWRDNGRPVILLGDAKQRLIRGDLAPVQEYSIFHWYAVIDAIALRDQPRRGFKSVDPHTRQLQLEPGLSLTVTLTGNRCEWRLTNQPTVLLFDRETMSALGRDIRSGELDPTDLLLPA